MPKICYVKKRFGASALATITKANGIIAEYEGQGFELTLRQLYYQFVSRDLIPNNMKAYKNLGSIVNDARMAGLIDWDHITDRTRELRKLAHWTSGSDLLGSAAEQFRMDLWEGQRYRPEVWIEKDALLGVIEGVCEELDMPYFSCRGYTSQSEMWNGAMRLKNIARHGQIPLILHFGDHDPSGKDMTRDIVDRLQLFMGGVEVNRLALNMAQIERYKPPPNPAKLTDSRAESYIAEFGSDSWELDALEPKVIVNLIRTTVKAHTDMKKWKASEARVEEERTTLTAVAERWEEVKEFLS